jgi:hypothetical protein
LYQRAALLLALHGGALHGSAIERAVTVWRRCHTNSVTNRIGWYKLGNTGTVVRV